MIIKTISFSDSRAGFAYKEWKKKKKVEETNGRFSILRGQKKINDFFFFFPKINKRRDDVGVSIK